MPGVTRMGVDTAGGTLTQGSPNVFVNGCPASRLNDSVAGHGLGPHGGPVMATGTQTVIVNGLPLCRAVEDVATCGHQATGSPNVYAGGGSFVAIVTVEPGVVLVGGVHVYDNSPVGQTAASAAEEVASPGMSTEKKAGTPVPQPVPVPAPTTKPSTKPEPENPPCDCKQFPVELTVSDTAKKVSNYFKLSHCGGIPVAQRNLTAGDIACNWQALCINILDHVYDEFKFNINSGWRPVSGGKGMTDHGVGSAADLSMGDVDKNIEMFKWIVKSSLPFTQIIYERKGNTGSGWIHISFNTAPRGAARTMWTFDGGINYHHGGKDGHDLIAALNPVTTAA